MEQIRTKLLALAMMVIMAFAMGTLIACTDSDVDPNAEDTPAEVLNTAVVYYSSTGTTQSVAEMIAAEENAVLFDITPQVSYSAEDLDYGDPDSRVSQERDMEERNIDLVMDQMPSWDSYNVVFLGYPIWWGEAAWPVQSFVQANNFSGKTVIPFCTSASSDIGNSAQELMELTRTGHWVDGMRFSAATTREEVNEWIASLGLYAPSDSDETEPGDGTPVEA